MADNHGAGDSLSRRALLRGAAAGGLAVATGCKYGTQAKSQDVSWTESRVQAYRPLGRTGFSMSDISFDCAGLDDAGVARRGVERGITYFDTSPDYSHTGSETALGAGIRGTPRDRLFVMSKFCTANGHLADDAPVPEVIAAVAASLKRLGTDYIDLVHIHAAFDRLKPAGKARFLGAGGPSGVPSHRPP